MNYWAYWLTYVVALVITIAIFRWIFVQESMTDILAFIAALIVVDFSFNWRKLTE